MWNFARCVFVLLLGCLVLIGACDRSKSNVKNANTGVRNKHYLYYLHGRIIEDMGPDNAVSDKYGKYEYRKILKKLKGSGFEVIHDERAKGTDVNGYSTKLAFEIRKRIESGVRADRIAVVGASKSSLIAMLTSTKLRNKNVRFVFMGNCNKWVKDNYDLDFYGKILSIYEKTDKIGGNSCIPIKENSTGISEFSEIKINTGLGHGFLYRPLGEWMDPAVKWALS